MNHEKHNVRSLAITSDLWDKFGKIFELMKKRVTDSFSFSLFVEGVRAMSGLVLLLSLFAAVFASSGVSFYINGPQQGVFGSELTFFVFSFPLQCAVVPIVRVTGPQGQIVPFDSTSCVNGVTSVSFPPCASGFFFLCSRLFSSLESSSKDLMLWRC
jgi:hypothetical protein